MYVISLIRVSSLFGQGSSNSFFFFFCWGPHHTACGISVAQPGIEPRPLTLRAQSPNHWTARELPVVTLHNTSV